MNRSDYRTVNALCLLRGSLEFNSRAGQILHNVANNSLQL